MNYISLVLLFLISSFSIAQVSISRQVIGSTGTFYIGSSTSISSTVGEPVILTFFSPNSIITQGFQQPETLIEVDTALTFYKGITPNGDGKNDSWIIDDIEFFPNNSVKIFNRWGEILWKRESYDNNEVVWAGEHDNGENLLTGTYFYVVIVEGKSYKGWVELTR